jgi:hypothetical protein
MFILTKNDMKIKFCTPEMKKQANKLYQKRPQGLPCVRLSYNTYPNSPGKNICHQTRMIASSTKKDPSTLFINVRADLLLVLCGFLGLS